LNTLHIIAPSFGDWARVINNAVVSKAEQTLKVLILNCAAVTMRLVKELQEQASKIIKSATNPPLLIICIFYIVE
jgi:hypothetical protein